jgi:DNA-directed RNA polymerase subunit RPC12/RpoP
MPRKRKAIDIECQEPPEPEAQMPERPAWQPPPPVHTEDPGIVTQDDSGLDCPACGSYLNRVETTRPIIGWIRRYRVCIHCGKRFRTIERTELEKK